MGLRDWLNARDARRMVRRQQFPETVERTYWNAPEYTRDAARLEQLGYLVESETDNDPYVTSGSIPRGGSGPDSQYGRLIRRRVPIVHVIYQRRASTGEQSTN